MCRQVERGGKADEDPVKVLGQNTDDYDGLAGDDNVFAEDGRIPMVVGLPEAIVQHGRPAALRPSRYVIGRSKQPADERPKTQHGKSIAGDERRRDGAQGSLIVRNGDHLVHPSG